MWSMKKLIPICVEWGLKRRRGCVCARYQSGKTRWAWLAVNLCTAFIASRVIDGFEHTISQLVALASLMPIVAGIGGNTGNQTITMIVRALALQNIQPGNLTFLILREMGVAVINGLVWGGIMGGITRGCTMTWRSAE